MEAETLTELISLAQKLGVGSVLNNLFVVIITLVALKRFVFNGLGAGLASLLNIASDTAKGFLANEKARIEVNVKTGKALEDLADNLKDLLELFQQNQRMISEHRQVTEKMFTLIAKRKTDYFYTDKNVQDPPHTA